MPLPFKQNKPRPITFERAMAEATKVITPPPAADQGELTGPNLANLNKGVLTGPIPPRPSTPVAPPKPIGPQESIFQQALNNSLGTVPRRIVEPSPAPKIAPSVRPVTPVGQPPAMSMTSEETPEGALRDYNRRARTGPTPVVAQAPTAQTPPPAPQGPKVSGKRKAKEVYAQANGNPSAPMWDDPDISLEDIMGAYDSARAFEGRAQDPAARFTFKRQVMSNRRESLYKGTKLSGVPEHAGISPAEILSKADQELFGGDTLGDEEKARSLFQAAKPDAGPEEFEQVWGGRQKLAGEILDLAQNEVDNAEWNRNQFALKTFMDEWRQSGVAKAVNAAAPILDPFGGTQRSGGFGRKDKYEGDAALDPSKLSLGERVGLWAVKASGGVFDLADDSDMELVARSALSALQPVTTGAGAATGLAQDEQAMWLRATTFIGDVAANVATAGVGIGAVAAAKSIAAAGATKVGIAQSAAKIGIAQGMGVTAGSYGIDLIPSMYEAGEGNMSLGAIRVGSAISQLLDPKYYMNPDVSPEDKALSGMSIMLLLLGGGYTIKQARARVAASRVASGAGMTPSIFIDPASRKAQSMVAKMVSFVNNRATGTADARGVDASDIAEMIAAVEASRDAGLDAAVRDGMQATAEYTAHRQALDAASANLKDVSKRWAEGTASEDDLLAALADYDQLGRDWDTRQAVWNGKGDPADMDNYDQIPVFEPTGTAPALLADIADAIKESKPNKSKVPGTTNMVSKLGSLDSAKALISSIFTPGSAGHRLMDKIIVDSTLQASTQTFKIATAIRKFAANLPFAQDARARAIMQEYAMVQHYLFDDVGAGRTANAQQLLQATGATTPDEFLLARLNNAGYKPGAAAVLAEQIKTATKVGRTLMNISARASVDVGDAMRGGDSAAAAEAFGVEMPELKLGRFNYYWSQAYDRADQQALVDTGFIGQHSQTMTPGRAAQSHTPAAATLKRTSDAIRGDTLQDPKATLAKGTPKPLDGIDTLVEYADRMMANVAYAPRARNQKLIDFVFNQGREKAGQALRYQSDATAPVIDAMYDGIALHTDTAHKLLIDLHERTVRGTQEAKIGPVDLNKTAQVVGAITGNVLAFLSNTMLAQPAALANVTMDVGVKHIKRGWAMAHQSMQADLEAEFADALDFIHSQTRPLPGTGPSTLIKGVKAGGSMGVKPQRVAAARNVGMWGIQAAQSFIDKMLYFGHLSQELERNGGDMAAAAEVARARFTDLYPRVQGLRSPIYDNALAKTFVTPMTGEPYYQMRHMTTGFGRLIRNGILGTKEATRLQTISRLTAMTISGFGINLVSKSMTGNSYVLIDPLGEIADANATLDDTSIPEQMMDGEMPNPFLDVAMNEGRTAGNIAQRGLRRLSANTIGNVPGGGLTLGVLKDAREEIFRDWTQDTQASSGQAFLGSTLSRTLKGVMKGGSGIIQGYQARQSGVVNDRVSNELIQYGANDLLRAMAPFVPGGAQMAKSLLTADYMGGRNVGNATEPIVREPGNTPMQDFVTVLGGVHQSPEALKNRQKRQKDDLLGF